MHNISMSRIDVIQGGSYSYLVYMLMQGKLESHGNISWFLPIPQMYYFWTFITQRRFEISMSYVYVFMSMFSCLTNWVLWAWFGFRFNISIGLQMADTLRGCVHSTYAVTGEGGQAMAINFITVQGGGGSKKAKKLVYVLRCTRPLRLSFTADQKWAKNGTWEFKKNPRLWESEVSKPLDLK